MFADLVRGHRYRLGLTQQELAAQSGVAVRTIRGIEAGRITRPRPGTARLLADVLALSGVQRETFLHAALGDQPGDDRGTAATTSDRAEPVPAQLPADVPGFTGRDAEMTVLDALIGPDPVTARTAVISAVSGTAGVGKTALAVRWGHRVAPRFPDGQLYLNLRGYDPGQPMTPADALARLLDSLGVAGTDVPVDVDARAARYRTQIAARRMLIVLDNASTVEQVRPLLPGTALSTVLITSRDRLAGLVARDGASRIDLDLLPPDDAHALLRRLIGDRVEAEPRAATALVERCCRLPLALRIAAELAVSRPQTPLADLVADLTDHGRLHLLDAGGDPHTAVTAVFSWSVRHLSPGAARLFRLLGVHPGLDVSRPAAASLAGATTAEVTSWLAELTQAHLLNEVGPDRYGFHDLLRDFAAHLARQIDSAADRRRAVRRALDYYVHTAHEAAMVVDPNRDPITPAEPEPGVTRSSISTRDEAIGWFAAERSVVLAAIRQTATVGLDVHLWQLAWGIAPYLHRVGLWDDLVETQQAAIAATRRLGDPLNEAACHRLLGRAYERLRRYDLAEVHYSESLRLFEMVAPTDSGRARTYTALSDLSARMGRYQEALHHADQALRVYLANDNRAGQGIALNTMAWYHAQLGNLAEALSHGERAIAVLQAVDEPHGEAAAWDTLGYVHHNLGQHDRAIECYQRALAHARASAHRYHEALALDHMADAQAASGDLDTARDSWLTALEILMALKHPDAAQVRAKLDQVRAATSGK